jgi:hypothetical protein
VQLLVDGKQLPMEAGGLLAGLVFLDSVLHRFAQPILVKLLLDQVVEGPAVQGAHG